MVEGAKMLVYSEMDLKSVSAVALPFCPNKICLVL